MNLSRMIFKAPLILLWNLLLASAEVTTQTSYSWTQYDPSCVMMQTVTDPDRPDFEAQSCTGYVFHGSSTRSDGSIRDCYSAELACYIPNPSTDGLGVFGDTVVGRATFGYEDKTYDMEATIRHSIDDWRDDNEWMCTDNKWDVPWGITVYFP
ncbi:hypothetical protein PV05_11409 [Exophiala xenobiotica]|uniref:Ecp2 effector protein domain-containing protein n=1 Tax=Exophiala xenobiotica TaxID=348802 RepID=A0A0D2E4R3_9EURO|nr:uncharacterized protein PV05_11409 [Exophiala xenobiotica]KIW49760.1 hypothetical protein PV05_11409 [Exophiala xenobiotica]